MISEGDVAWAVADLRTVFADGEGLCGQFTCSEIDHLARALARLDMADLAERVIRCHVYDLLDQEDDTHGHLITVKDDGHVEINDEQAELVRDHVQRLVAWDRQPGDYWGPDGEEGPL